MQPPRARIWAGPLIEVGALWLLIVLGGVLLIAGLLDAARQQELQTLERAQLELTLRELQEEIEGDLSLGVDLAGNPRAEEMLLRQREKDGRLLSLDMLDAQGRALFSTDRGTLGEPLPAAARAAALQGAARREAWHAFIESTPMMGLAVRNAFGETAGHVSATYDSQAAGPFSAAMFSAPLVLALCATALGGMAAVWLATRAQRGLRRVQEQGRLARVEARLAHTRARLDEGAQRLDAVERIE